MAYRILAISAPVVGGWSSPGGILMFLSVADPDAKSKQKEW